MRRENYACLRGVEEADSPRAWDILRELAASFRSPGKVPRSPFAVVFTGRIPALRTLQTTDTTTAVSLCGFGQPAAGRQDVRILTFSNLDITHRYPISHQISSMYFGLDKMINLC